MEKHDLDIVIIGGGIAALWLAQKLQQNQYAVALLEKKGLGAGQSGFSQGIIHGGMKYALQGKVNASAQAVSDMVQIWQRALMGEGSIDLSGAQILSGVHHLCMMGGVGAKIKALISSQLLHSRSDVLPTESLHPFLQHPDFKAKVCELAETVLDVPTVISQLAHGLSNSLYQVDETPELVPAEDGFDVLLPQHDICLRPRKVILLAGQGNQDYLTAMGLSVGKLMQIRPLHMVAVALDQPIPLYMHVIEQGTKPALTITTHYRASGEALWYLGGELSEQGVHQTSEALIDQARQQLTRYFPWGSFADLPMKTLRIDRAEGAMPGKKKPPGPMITDHQNVVAAWPTKLTLAPQLAMQLVDRIEAAGVTPRGNLTARLMDLPEPPVSPGIAGIFDEVVV